MRPQHITAENGAADAGCRGAKSRASMRPQHITAENHHPPVVPPAGRLASMRPQHITAENGTTNPPEYLWVDLLQ